MESKPKPRIIMHNDGRVCWPDVILYRYSDDPPNVYHAVPPKVVELNYSVIVLDLNKHHELLCSGALFSREHTGYSGSVVDNRKGGRG